MKQFISVFIIMLISAIAGCAEITPPSPEAIISPWSSMPNIRLGDTKEDVISRWGEPDEKNEIGVDELGVSKQEWVYYGRYPVAIVDYQYLSKTKYLYFEGNILVRQETKSTPRFPQKNN
ncbi:MAG: hypothetical protein V2A72_08445 [Candidatus Omnitrophota bacterium]